MKWGEIFHLVIDVNPEVFLVEYRATAVPPYCCCSGFSSKYFFYWVKLLLPRPTGFEFRVILLNVLITEARVCPIINPLQGENGSIYLFQI